MHRSPVVVLHPVDPIATSATPGMEFRTFVDRDRRWIGLAGLIKNDAGDRSGWHHHADNETYVYVVRGSITFEFGERGSESVVAGAGDFVVVPAHTIHNEVTSDDTDLEAFVMRIGGEPERVDVDGPPTDEG